jgi:hypothetical protein
MELFPISLLWHGIPSMSLVLFILERCQRPYFEDQVGMVVSREVVNLS